MYPFPIMIAAAAVFASVSHELHQWSCVEYQPCRRPVCEARLLDFYMRRFVNVPLLHITDVLKWDEPLCDDQSPIEFLILAFQAVVDVPTSAALRFYRGTRHAPAPRVTADGPPPRGSAPVRALHVAGLS